MVCSGWEGKGRIGAREGQARPEVSTIVTMATATSPEGTWKGVGLLGS